MTNDNNAHTVATEVIISRQLLDGQPTWTIDDEILSALLNPPSPEQLAAERAERERIWDEKTAAGMVGLASWADYDRVERGEYVHKWITADLWNRYTAAREALDELESEME